jgi:hypothetical protein
MRASFGKIVLTCPEFLGGVIGKPMAGYTPAPKVTGKYDDIMAHAVMIEDTYLGNINKRMVFISLDFLKVSFTWTDYVKDQIEDAYKIHPNQVLIHAIHTHKSMDMTGEFVFGGNLQNTIKGIMVGGYYSDDKYKIWVAWRLVELVGQLIKDLKPAKVAWAKQTINDDLIINRRHPLRRSKGTVSVICFKELESNNIMGILTTFGMHPTTLASFVDKISADYPGRVIEKIEQLSDNKVQAAFFTAPCGDLNPITTIGNNFEHLATLPQDSLLGQKGDLPHTKKLGYRIGAVAYELATQIPDNEYYDKVDFRAYVKTFWVPMQDVTHVTQYKGLIKLYQRAVYLIKRYVLFPVALFMAEAAEPNFPGFAVKHKGIWKNAKINVYSQVVYIRWICASTKTGKTKNLAITGIPGELFEDYGREFGEQNPEGVENTIVIQNANDWVSYLFSIKEYTTTGGYEPFASFSPISGTWVKFAYLRLLKDVKDDIIAGFY